MHDESSSTITFFKPTGQQGQTGASQNVARAQQQGQQPEVPQAGEQSEDDVSPTHGKYYYTI